ncbi:hypothetical protein EBZ80_20325 [bacterium]|nr:hypothetical protein [bacterium]
MESAQAFAMSRAGIEQPWPTPCSVCHRAGAVPPEELYPEVACGVEEAVVQAEGGRFHAEQKKIRKQNP